MTDELPGELLTVSEGVKGEEATLNPLSNGDFTGIWRPSPIRYRPQPVWG
jgi:hypothetical protein